jgi:ribose transport system ATP-binding protein
VGERIAVGSGESSSAVPPVVATSSTDAATEPTESAPSTSAVALSVTGLSKTYPGMQALKSLNLDIRSGELHALVGGNGSGKSTFVKLLAGVERADAGGEVTVGGRVVEATGMTPAIARSMGMRFVHQDAGVFGDISIAENLALGRGFSTGAGGRVRWKELRRDAEKLLSRVGLRCDPTAILSSLSASSQTLVAVARALADIEESATILILDEPTAALPNDEAHKLLSTLRTLTTEGLAVLLITHRLDEVVGVADRVSAFRGGNLVGTVTGDDVTHDRLIEFIVGRPLSAVFPEMPEPKADADDVLTIENLSAGILQDVSFTVRRGEIVGIAGLLGTGRTTMLRTIFGEYKPRGGSLTVLGRTLAGHSAHDAIARGIGFVPEDRKNDAVFNDLSVRENLVAAALPAFFGWSGMSKKRETEESARARKDFGIKSPDLENPISSLSGGNQQKAVLARWLRLKPALLLLDEPTQGVDIGARADIYAIIRRAVEEGASVLLVASDFDELARVSDRVIVLRDGRVAAEVKPPELDQHVLTQLAYKG